MMGTPPPPLPLWFRLGVIGVLMVLLSLNVYADIYVTGYNGQFVTLALLGLVGAAIGIAKSFTGDGK